MGPEAIAATSIASLGLDTAGPILKGTGEAAGQNFMADQAERAAALGRIKADQTDVALRDELSTTLGNIDVIRAAGGTNALSPTGLAIKAREQEVSDRQRITTVGNIREQAAEKEREADYRRTAGKYALLGGYIGGASKFGKGIGGGK